LKILTDTREQLPYLFEKYPVKNEPAALAVGDYSLAGFQDRIAIERKSLNDLIGCLTGSNRTRFEKELARAGSFERFAVIIESDIQDISAGRYTSNMKPHAALQSITAFFIRYGIPFLFCGNRDGAEYITYSILQKYYYEIEKRFKIIQKQQCARSQQDD
jgi:DNA excision repair protein ERCC-4